MKWLFPLPLVALLCTHQAAYCQKATFSRGDTMTFDGFVLMPGDAGSVGVYTAEGDVPGALPVFQVGENYFIPHHKRPFRFNKALKSGMFFTSFTRFAAFLPPASADSVKRDLATRPTVISTPLPSVVPSPGARTLHYSKFWRAQGVTGALHLVKIRFRYVAYKQLLITLPNPAYTPKSRKKTPWLNTPAPTFFITNILQAEIVKRQF